MVNILSQTISFWVGLTAAVFIMLHIPSCNVHWANKLKPFSTYLAKHHALTLSLATIFALAHILLSVIGLITGVWI